MAAARKPTIAFDWNGVLDESPDDVRVDIPPEELDFSPVDDAFQRGWNVAIVTAARPGVVARALKNAGFQVYVDRDMRLESWNGTAPDGRHNVILVTNRKISASVYVDDKAVNWIFGEPMPRLWKGTSDIREMVARTRARLMNRWTKEKDDPTRTMAV